MSIATTRRYKDASGQQQEETEWHRVAFFGRLAEIAGEYLRKGRPVYVEGRLRTRKWQDKEGQDRYTTEIVAENMQLLGSREGSGAGTDFEAAMTSRAPAPARAAERFDPPPNRPATSPIWTTTFRSGAFPRLPTSSAGLQRNPAASRVTAVLLRPAAAGPRERKAPRLQVVHHTTNTASRRSSAYQLKNGPELPAGLATGVPAAWRSRC